mgnify:CR=1 FL=1
MRCRLLQRQKQDDIKMENFVNASDIKKEEIVQYLMDAIPDKLEAYMI